MRLPNGFGNVSKLPGNRRKPYRARVTTGWRRDAAGKQHQEFKTLGYYATREEGLIALSNYHQHPELVTSRITFEEMYRLWSKEHFPKISPSNQRGYEAAFRHCQALHGEIFRELRRIHLQQVIDRSSKNYSVLRRIKILYSQLYRFALQNDLCEKDYARYVDVAQYKDRNPNTCERKPFSGEEIAILWDAASYSSCASIVLMLIYSGCRVGELLELKKEDVYLEQRYFYVGHAKTSSGIRYVPIAEKVYPFWDCWYHSGESGYLLSGANTACLSYHNFYRSYWIPLMERLELAHLPHDTRHTCITMLTLAGVDDKKIRKIVGHKGENVTEVVYTHFKLDELREAINQI